MNPMELISKPSAFPCLAILTTFAAIAGLVGINSCQAQDRPVVDQPLISVEVARGGGSLYDAAKIIGFRLDGLSYDLSSLDPVRFDTTSDWLERVQFVVKNVASKTVIAANIQVECPRMSRFPLVYPTFILPLIVGRAPDRWLYPNEVIPAQRPAWATKAAISTPPQGELIFALKDAPEGLLARVVNKQQIVQTECIVALSVVHFSNGMMWQPHQFYKPDPKASHGYIKITPEEFGMSVSME